MWECVGEGVCTLVMFGFSCIRRGRASSQVRRLNRSRDGFLLLSPFNDIYLPSSLTTHRKF